MNEARRWLLQAEQDLDDAEFNSSGGRYNVACSKNWGRVQISK